MTDKFCRDCRHSAGPSHPSSQAVYGSVYRPYRMCQHPSLGTDVVEGVRNELPCADMRASTGRCGPDGSMFERPDVGLRP